MTKEIRRLRELAGLNRNDKFVLNELFDNPYPYEWAYQGEYFSRAKFKNVNEHVILVNFTVNDFHDVAEIEFNRNGDTKATGQKDQFRIFTTVINIIKDFIKNNSNVGEFYFVAKEKSRVLLYRRMLNHFANENNLNFKENKFIKSTEFILSRKD